MEMTEISKCCISNEVEKEEDNLQDLLETLPSERNIDGRSIYFYKGFWGSCNIIKGTLSFQQHFEAHDSDIILATVPKAGTTWLKALTFSIVNRTKFSLSQTPLLTTNPHGLVRFCELDLFLKHENPNLHEGFGGTPAKILATHLPFEALPQSIVTSKCRIVYICRNPLDQFVSSWHFLLQNPHENTEVASIDEAFEMYYRGVHYYGPFWDHVLGYWRASMNNQHKVLIMKYEDLKEDTTSHMKKLAEFLGFPFSKEEENEGVIEQISRLCSLENLKNLEINNGMKRQLPTFTNSSFFRKGQVGDWANFLPPSAAERLQKLAEEKLGGSGFTYKAFCQPSS